MRPRRPLQRMRRRRSRSSVANVGTSSGSGAIQRSPRGLASGGHTIGRGVRHLAERQIFGELPRREPFGGAFEQAHRRRARQGRAALRRERNGPECRHERTPLQVRAVILGRAQENGDAIERDAVACQREHAASDLDAFAAFARRGEHLDLVVGLRLWGFVALVKEVTLEPRECAGAGCITRSSADGHVIEIFDLEPKAIAETSDGRTSAAGTVASAAGAVARSAVTNASSASLAIATSRRSVGRPISRCRSGPPDRIRRERQHARPIGEDPFRQLGFICPDQRHEIRRNACRSL